MFVSGGFLIRFVMRSKDAIRYSRVLKVSALVVLTFLSLLPASDRRKLGFLCDAYGTAKTSRFRHVVRWLLRPFLEGSKLGVWEICRPHGSRPLPLPTASLLSVAIVLKEPRGDERGVLLIRGERVWGRLFAADEAVRYFNDNYYLVLAATWSPTCYRDLGLMSSRVRDKVFVEPGNLDEKAAIEDFSQKIQCLPSIHCDWINPEWFHPRPWGQRSIDIVMVSAWAPYKRHWYLFDLLRRMSPHLRVVLIGQPDGRFTVDHVRRQAALFGVKQEITFISSIPVEEVHEYLCNSRVSVIASRHEGGCVAVAESLFADTPVAMLRGADIGSARYINSQTGIFLDPRKAHNQLQEFIEQAGRCRARDWAMENISCHKSHAKLNTVIRTHAVACGHPWTCDLKRLCWHPFPMYVNKDDRREFTAVYADLHNRFPELF